MGSRLRISGILITGIGLVLLNRLLLRIGLRRPIDGWRRGAGLVLRNEPATFVLSAIGLEVWSDVERPPLLNIEQTEQHLAARLAKFLAGQPAMHICIYRGADEDHGQACDGASYTLRFEPNISGSARFIRPDEWDGLDCCPWKQPGEQTPIDVLLKIVGRVHPDGSADLWVKVNHIGTDGVPAQEMLTQLEKEWGLRSDVRYPTPESFEPYSKVRPFPGGAGLGEVQSFVDLTTLLAWRKEQNGQLPEPMTISAAILWRLAHHPVFSSLYMGTTVEVQAVGGLDRGVGVVVIRPADYFDQQNALANYVRDFNRRMRLTRHRQSESCKTLDAVALIPPKLATALLRHGLDQGTKAFGSLALTILKDAKVFGAPLGDYGHPHGFIALGSAALPCEDGRHIGCITVKGPAAEIADYPKYFQEAIRIL